MSRNFPPIDLKNVFHFLEENGVYFEINSNFEIHGAFFEKVDDEIPKNMTSFEIFKDIIDFFYFKDGVVFIHFDTSERDYGWPSIVDENESLCLCDFPVVLSVFRMYVLRDGELILNDCLELEFSLKEEQFEKYFRDQDFETALKNYKNHNKKI